MNEEARQIWKSKPGLRLLSKVLKNEPLDALDWKTVDRLKKADPPKLMRGTPRAVQLAFPFMNSRPITSSVGVNGDYQRSSTGLLQASSLLPGENSTGIEIMPYSPE
jgi:hypothetical protein